MDNYYSTDALLKQAPLGLHAIVGLLFGISILPKLPSRLKYGSLAAAHLLLALFHLFLPRFFLRPTVLGKDDQLLSFLQAFVAPTHISLAYTALNSDGHPPEKQHQLGRVVSAILVVFTRLFALYNYAQKSTSINISSQQYLVAVALTDGAWLTVEFLRLMFNQRTSQDEIGLLKERLSLWEIGGDLYYGENALLLDSALCVLYAFFHFAFPNHILRLVLKTDAGTIGSQHVTWTRVYGGLLLSTGISSIGARHLTLDHQLTYIWSRFIAQAIIFALHIYGHWVLKFYTPNHTTGFMIAGFHMTFLMSTHYRVRGLTIRKQHRQESSSAPTADKGAATTSKKRN